MAAAAGPQDIKVERVEETFLLDPFLLVDQHAMHERDLPGGPAEADEAELEPEAERLFERDGFVHCCGQALLFHIWGRWRKACSVFSSSISSSGASSFSVCKSASARCCSPRCSACRWVRRSRSSASPGGVP